MYYDDQDRRPKWDRPEIDDWDDEEDFSRDDYTNDRIICMPTSTPCWPRQCWPRPCWPRQCAPRQCWPRQHCWPRQCWPRQHCWPRPCQPNQCWPRR